MEYCFRVDADVINSPAFPLPAGCIVDCIFRSVRYVRCNRKDRTKSGKFNGLSSSRRKLFLFSGWAKFMTMTLVEVSRQLRLTFIIAIEYLLDFPIHTGQVIHFEGGKKTMDGWTQLFNIFINRSFVYPQWIANMDEHPSIHSSRCAMSRLMAIE